MDFNRERVEKIGLSALFFIIVIILFYQVFSIVGVFPMVPCVSGWCCIGPTITICAVLMTYILYRYRLNYDQKTNERIEKSLNTSVKFMMITTVAATIVGVIVMGFFTLMILCFLLGGLNYLPHFMPSTGDGTAMPSTALWHNYNGQINVNTEKLVRTDPIVAIWQSHDASFTRPNNNAAYDYRPIIIENFKTDNFILIFYNDNTYILYDRNNSTYKKGTWSKTTNNEYTLYEGTVMSSPEKIVDNPSRGNIQLQSKEEGSPPQVISSYMNYNLVDYDPLMPDTIAKINKRS